MISLELDTGNVRYPIHIGSGLMARAASLISPLLPAPRVIIVADEAVASLYAPQLEAALKQANIRSDRLMIPSGEMSKSFATLEQLMSALLALRPDRKTTLLALGGGVTGDLCGFAASILLRGVPFIQIPTTLLAMVDSSVGGKTGINTQAGKNLVGSFHQPLAVIADTDTLASLPEREMRAGYAEIVKMAAIRDDALFAWLEQNSNDVLERKPQAITHAIAAACSGKAEVVAADEKEGGLRATLNFGHTFGHALEAECAYGDSLRHGEAVAAGMVMAARLSARMGLCDGSIETKLAAHLRASGLPTGLGNITPPTGTWDIQKLAQHFYADKKSEGGTLTFIGLTRIGEATIIRDVKLADATAALS